MKVTLGIIAVVLALEVALSARVIIRQSLTLYSSDESVALQEMPVAGAFFEKLKAGELAKPKDLIAAVKISLKTELRPVLVRSVDLKWVPRQNLKTFFLSPQSSAPIRLSDFDRLWVDYQNFSPQNSCGLSARLLIQVEGSKRGRAQRSSILAYSRELRSPQEIKFYGVDWRAKDFRYLLGRSLGLAPDSTWRYTPFNRVTVLQARFHRDISLVQRLDLVLKPGVKFKTINLRLTDKDNNGPGDLVQLGKIHGQTTDENGNQVIHIPIARLAQERFPEALKTYLQEIQVFVAGNPDDVIRYGALREMVFLGGFRHSTIDGVALMASSKKSANGQTRFIVDLGISGRDMPTTGRPIIKAAWLNILPKSPADSCGVLIKRIRLVQIENRQVPVKNMNFRNLSSLRKNLKAWRVFNVGGKKGISISPSDHLLRKLLRGPVSLSLNAATFAEIARFPNAVKEIESPYLQIDSIAVEPLSPLPRPVWARLTKIPTKPDPWWIVFPRLLIIMIVSILVLCEVKWWENSVWTSFVFSTALVVILYGMGLTFLSFGHENYYFTWGGLAAVFSLRVLGFIIEPGVRQRFPALADSIYGEAGSLYFSWAVIFIGLTAVFLMMKINFISEQAGIIVYYCLLIGVARRIWALRGGKDDAW